MTDYSNNYRWEIPKKFKIDWYNDFLKLINQIDAQLKQEEQQRIQQDNFLFDLISQAQPVTQYRIFIPIRNSTSGKASVTSTSWVERVNVSAYVQEYFGLNLDDITQIDWFITYRARVVNSGDVGYIKARFRQTIPSGQYIETEIKTITSTSWNVFYEQYNDVPIQIFTPNGLLDCMLMLRVDTGTIEAYMDRAFLILIMRG